MASIERVPFHVNGVRTSITVAVSSVMAAKIRIATGATASLVAQHMPDLLIRIKKKTDGSAALTCTRADGSVTWQRQDGQLGRFFPLHDLTHYAVEQTLGFPRAFYGLLAEGWAVAEISRAAVPDMPDRIIAATARRHGLPLVSRDRKIRACGIETIW